MKLKLLVLSAFSISAISTLIPGLTPSAKAVCVLTDVGVQVAIHGKNSVANQNNKVDQQASNDCYGNSATTSGVQVYTGSGSVNQNRNVGQYVSGGSANNPTGVPMPVIKIHVNPQIDVPAYPNF
ncbi:hypothetical protein [Brunnivagina elsteri]|uniref:Uncharacterized protein n=1 Tax=Brunnivagina elsteri CCALA 953 TaxID=987040 RepID=A0A2A2TMR7_9CYAN|nr:hypothetical protein [Calothrix elsteri]PAX59634.1 hypothetical protein CK510_06120 [Calothrix elsteri CCALA 953]